jgi:hypothetical protein
VRTLKDPLRRGAAGSRAGLARRPRW